MGELSTSRLGALAALVAAALALGAAALTASAEAANYKMVLCAGDNGSNDFDIETHGSFDVQNYCGPAPDPAGSHAFVRIKDNEKHGEAANGAYGRISWWVPSGLGIVAGGGWTRQASSFNAGWRSRFWTEGFDGSRPHNILMQGAGVDNDGIYSDTSSTFNPHLWPFSGWGNYRRFVFELECVRSSGCDREGYNQTDANTITLTIDDKHASRVEFTHTDEDLLAGRWVKGRQTSHHHWTETESGMRFERLLIDGAERWSYDYNSRCNRHKTSNSGEFARVWRPCPTDTHVERSYAFDTDDLADGEHTIEVCTQDYGQWQGIGGSGGQTCKQRTIRTDNTPPGKPAALAITSANPARYLSHFGAAFSLPPDPGSPIARVHYQVRSAKGEVVTPTKTLAGTDPTAIPEIQGPAEPGAYRLRVWLTDSVGQSGPAAEVAIPRDTTPPAAPQELEVAGAASRWQEQVDLGWQNLVDDGAPITLARYRFLDASGKALGGTHTLAGANPEAIEELATPERRGHYKAQVWLADAEGNVGAAATVALPIDTEPPAAPQGLQIAAPDTSRTAEGFDLRWRDIDDDEGSPIVAAHYRIASGGEVAVRARTVAGRGIEKIDRITAPERRGSYTLALWLSDAEGNVGAPVRVPLSYDCVRSPVSGGRHLGAELGDSQKLTVDQGQGAALQGRLTGAHGGVGDAPICVFAQTEGERHRDFLGVAITGQGGSYRFAVGHGPNRTLTALYRPGQRRLRAEARIRTRVHPTLRARKRVVYNGEYAYLDGEVPGPRNDEVVVTIQVREGDGWLVFRRYSTRGGGHFHVRYPFRRTTQPTTYEMRAEVRQQVGYPYLQGDSDVVALRVLPKSAKREQAARRCPHGARWVAHPRRGKPRCARRVGIHRRCLRARLVVRRHPRAARLRRRAHRLCARSRRVRIAKRRAARRAARIKARRGRGGLMRTAGVDLSAAAKGTAHAQVEWGAGRARVSEPSPGLADPELLERLSAAEWSAIDAPFGWPEPMVDAVGAYAREDRWPSPAKADFRYRRTDRHVHDRVLAETGERLWPLSPSTDRIALTAWRLAGLREAGAERSGVRFDRGGGDRVIEAYPAAALLLWGLERRGYKGDGEVAATNRALLLAAIEARAPSDDALDAVICALIARAAALGLTEPPPESERELASVEGWVHLPGAGSLAELLSA